MNTQNVNDLSTAFSAIIREWLTPSELEAANEQNKKDKYHRDNCATHDYCDPNQAMLDAYEKVFKKEIEFSGDVEEGRITQKEHDEQWDIVNAAWDKSKRNHFKA